MLLPEPAVFGLSYYTTLFPICQQVFKKFFEKFFSPLRLKKAWLLVFDVNHNILNLAIKYSAKIVKCNSSYRSIVLKPVNETSAYTIFIY